MRINLITSTKLLYSTYTYPGIHPQVSMVMAFRSDACNDYEKDISTIKIGNTFDTITQQMKQNTKNNEKD